MSSMHLVIADKENDEGQDTCVYPILSLGSQNGVFINGSNGTRASVALPNKKPQSGFSFNIPELISGKYKPTEPGELRSKTNGDGYCSPSNVQTDPSHWVAAYNEGQYAFAGHPSHPQTRSCDPLYSHVTEAPNALNRMNKIHNWRFPESGVTYNVLLANGNKTGWNERQGDVSRSHSWTLSSTGLSTTLSTQTMSSIKTRTGSEKNKRWSMIIPKLEHYLDAHSLLMLRQTCLALYNHKYTINPQNELFFRGFVGYDSNLVITKVIPLLSRILEIKSDVSLVMNFSQCCNFRNSSMVYMLTAQRDLGEKLGVQIYCRNMRELVLDYCNHLTDKALEVMLTTRLPNLERLSLSGCRNEKLVGTPFVTMLSESKWPKFTKFNCSFSNISIEPIQAIADFIMKLGVTIGPEDTSIKTTSTSSEETLWSRGAFPICCDSVEINIETEGAFGPTTSENPYKPVMKNQNWQLEICGSWGSRLFLDRNGFGQDISAFRKALKMKNTKLCSRLTKHIQRELEERSSKEGMANNSCLQLFKQRGSEFLVNCPIIEKTNQAAIDIWTLPICIAIQNDDMEMFNLLIRRGARVNVWDHCGKSPLYTACEIKADRFFHKLLKLGHAPDPVDDRGFSALSVSIQQGNVDYLEKLLKSGFPVNRRCPHIRSYMSPLYIACKSNSAPCIKLLLERGADTNWLYHSRISPTLVAYQKDPRWLPVFIQYGAGKMEKKRFVLADVMSCAICNNDVRSVKLLLDTYPDLVEWEHGTWSKPMIQAARLGKLDVLSFMLDKNVDINQIGAGGKTALHAATEENRLECMKLLIQNQAEPNVQDAIGRTPLHLAVIDNRLDAIELLINNGGDPNLGDYSTGETPLMAALRTRNEHVAYLILNKSKTIVYNLLDKLGRSACVYCLYFECYEVGQTILAKYAELKLPASQTELRWFNTLSQERFKLKSATNSSLKRYVKQFGRVHSQTIRQSMESVEPPTKRSLMQSLRRRIYWSVMKRTSQ